MASVSGSVCPRQGPLLLTLLEALNRQKILGPHVVCLPHTSFDVCPPAACWHASSVTTCKNSLCSPRNHPINKSRMFQKKGWMVSVWNIANMWHTYDILCGTYHKCDTSCGIYDKCDTCYTSNTHIWHMWQIWHRLHMCHTYDACENVTHVTDMWHTYDTLCSTCDKCDSCMLHILSKFALCLNLLLLLNLTSWLILTLTPTTTDGQRNSHTIKDFSCDHRKYQDFTLWMLWSHVQTISAGLPVDPLLVDIISLFTKLTIARAGWSRSSSAKTWHCNK